jgi:polyvinyl alcohol dehydrogenase (cytochrome)
LADATFRNYRHRRYVESLDPATGKILWQTAEPTGSWAFGPVSVANGVVYAGAMDPKGYMRALDAATGKILWSFASGGSVASGPAIADGMVFWGSGYEHLNSPTVHQSVSNDMFYAFEPAGLPRNSRSNGRK